MIEKIINYLKKPYKILLKLDRLRLITLDDRKFLNYEWKARMGTKLNLDNPQTFDEKLQWLKLYNRKDIYTTMVDKYEVKKYVADAIGEEYLIPTIGIYDKFEEINFDKLPNKFVMKCTHDSGSVVICKDKSKFDFKKSKKKINKALKRNYFFSGREWPYKNIKPRIIIEEYMEDKHMKELTDYKIYSFDGKCEYVLTCCDRFKDKVKFIFFDKEWNIKKNFTNDGLKYGDTINIPKPKNLEKMFQFAEKLSKGIPFVRVDFYECNEKLYFGELTLYPSSGFDINRRSETNEYLSKNLNLEELK